MRCRSVVDTCRAAHRVRGTSNPCGMRRASNPFKTAHKLWKQTRMNEGHLPLPDRITQSHGEGSRSPAVTMADMPRQFWQPAPSCFQTSTGTTFANMTVDVGRFLLQSCARMSPRASRAGCRSPDPIFSCFFGRVVTRTLQISNPPSRQKRLVLNNLDIVHGDLHTTIDRDWPDLRTKRCSRLFAQPDGSFTSCARSSWFDSSRSKYLMVRVNPSLSAICGFQPSRSCAREISGWRCFGSFSGSGR